MTKFPTVLRGLLAVCATFLPMALWATQGSDEQKEYVDLGLSVKWATTNVGATSVTDGGTHFSWGDQVSITNRPYCYCYNSELDSLGHLPPWVDTATALWGEGWRMPTAEELAELANDENCRWEWDSKEKGFWVISLKKGFEGRRIFLPAAGLRDYSNAHYNFNKYGYLWSGERYDSYRAKLLIFGYDNQQTLKFNAENSRLNGANVRPVRKEKR